MMQIHKKAFKQIFIQLFIVLSFSIICTTLTTNAMAQSSLGSTLSLQVTPTPFVININPYNATNIELQIRNNGNNKENLKIEPRSFNVSESGEIKVDYSKTPDVPPWIEFKTPEFTLEPGQWSNQEIVLKIPRDPNYNYPFALVISRQENAAKKSTNSTNMNTVAIPILVNVDKPGTIRKLEIQKFSSAAEIYESLPVNFDLKIKNMGNMIVKPSGNVVILRGSNDKKPVATIPVNASKDYIFPGNSRTFTVAWKDSDKNKTPTIGLYTAKLSATYNDGVKDIQIEREVTFWLFPWKTILVIIVLLLSVFVAVWFMLRKNNKLPRIRKRTKQSPVS